MLPIDSSFYINNFFSTLQKEVFQQCSFKFQNFIEFRLMTIQSSENFKIINTLFEIIRLSDKAEQFYIENVLYELLSLEKNLINYLEKLQIIFLKNGQNCFIEISNIKFKIDIDIVISIIDDLFEIQKSIPSLSIFTSLPSYDCGGKEVLFELRNKEVKENHSSIKKIEISSKYNLSNLYDTYLPFNIFYENAIKYLSSLEEDQRQTMNFYIIALKKIKFDKNILDPHLKRSIILIIIKKTSNESEVFEKKYNLSIIEELTRYTLLIYDSYGIEIVDYFCHSLENLEKIYDCFSILAKLNNVFEIQEDIFQLLSKLFLNQITFDEFIASLMYFSSTFCINEIKECEDVRDILKRFSNDSNVKVSLSSEQIDEIGKDFSIIEIYCKTWKSKNLIELIGLVSEITIVEKLNKESILKLYAIARLAIWKKYSIYLHSTQILTVLGQMLFQRGCVVQKKTGEGKSFTTTLLALIICITNPNESLHIISSSDSLSLRDYENTYDFFKQFGITTSQICINKPSQNSFNARIIFGTATSFEFALMREMLWHEKLFIEEQSNKKYRFDNIIIDEFDSLIDTAFVGSRLSCPSDHDISWIYQPIYNFVKNSAFDSKNSNPREQIQKLRLFLNNYANGRFIDKLSQLSDKKLAKWFKSAEIAYLTKKENEHYIIVTKKEEGEKDKKLVEIVDDEHTGKVLHGMRWSDGIHEFTEVKHNLIPQIESLTPISLSHGILCKNYKKIYGLTGTIGSKEEREIIEKLYKVKTFDVPTYKPMIREDFPVRLFKNNVEHIQAIVDIIKSYRSKRRPILVLCPTIKRTNQLGDILNSYSIPHEILNEVQDKQEQEILSYAGAPGRITIATNNAGRGTDIKLEEESINNGGLHVLITFFPSTERVEMQARGRAGRQGQPGSSEIVVSIEDLHLNANISEIYTTKEIIFYLENKRESNVSSLKEKLLFNKKIDNIIFSYNCNFYNKIKELNKIISDDLYLTNLATFLNSIKINKDFIKHTIKQELIEDFTNLFTKKSNISEWKNLIVQFSKNLEKQLIIDWSLCFTNKTQIIKNKVMEEIDICIKSNSKKINYNTDEYFLNLLLETKQKIKKKHAIFFEKRKNCFNFQQNLFDFIEKNFDIRLDYKF